MTILGKLGHESSNIKTEQKKYTFPTIPPKSCGFLWNRQNDQIFSDKNLVFGKIQSLNQKGNWKQVKIYATLMYSKVIFPLTCSCFVIIISYILSYIGLVCHFFVFSQVLRSNCNHHSRFFKCRNGDMGQVTGPSFLCLSLAFFPLISTFTGHNPPCSKWQCSHSLWGQYCAQKRDKMLVKPIYAV